MNRLYFFILSVLLGLLPTVAAGPTELTGRVTDSDSGEPVTGVVVRAKGSFASTDKDGLFRLALRATADSVTFRCMGYETLTLPASADFTRISLKPKATRLRDVIVKAPDIYAKGDTLVFNVGRYARPEDNAIIDVIKRLPGIKVKDDGTIEYQGKPINSFYLDGKNFLGGQYGLATNNISYKDVASVEVMENHQPVKALEGIEFPEEAGINLKLKEDARSRWVGVAQAAAGLSPLLYDGSLFLMRIASAAQNMLTVKADNTGWNPASQIREHDFDDMFASGYAESLWPEYIAADAVSAPLSEKRTRDNLSWLANSITGWTSGDASMRVKLNYMADRLDYDNSLTTDYFSPSIPMFVQTNVLHSQLHNLSAQFNAEINKRGYYLKDRLTAEGEIDRSHSSITGSYDLMQRISRKSFKAVNDLKLVKRTNKKVFTLTSRNSFGYSPDRLAISGLSDALQTVGTTDARSTTETKIGRITRFWRYYLEGNIDLSYRHMNLALTGMDRFDNSDSYDAFLSDVSLKPQIEFERNKWRLMWSAPVKWLHHSLGGNRDYINIAPRFYARHQLTAKSEVSASAIYRLSSPQAYLSIESPVLSDYRNIFIGRNFSRYTQDVSVSSTYRFRNPLSALFANVSLTYNHRRSPVIADQLFIGDFVVSTSARQLNESNSWYISGGLSKGFGHSRYVAGLEVKASHSTGASMRDGMVIGEHQQSASFNPYFKGSFARWISLNYDARYSLSSLKFDGNSATYHSVTQTLASTVSPCDPWQFTVGAEHYLTRFPEGGTAGIVLLDASAVWIASRRTRLSLTASNLLNRKAYRYVTYGTLSRSEHAFRLRGRNVLATVQVRF